MRIFQKIADSILGRSEKKSVYDVFTPNQEAIGNHFVGRHELLGNVLSAIGEPGAQVFIYGAPGTGKSSLALRALEKATLLERCRRIHFSVNTGKEDFLGRLWKAATGNLPKQYEMSGSLKAGFAGTGVDTALKERYADSLSSETVSEAMFQSNQIFLLDDVERLSADAYPLLADLVKKMTDLRWKNNQSISRVICIAAMRDIGLVFNSDPSASSRIKKFLVRELAPSEMRLISKGGFDQLDIETDDLSLSRIHYFSSGFPRILHKVCGEVASHAIEADPLNKRIGLYVQGGLDRFGGDGSIELGIESARKKIAESSRCSRLPLSHLETIAISAALLTQDSFDAKEIMTVLSYAEMSIENVQKYIDSLCEAKLLEAVSGRHDDISYSFVTVADRLGLRFLTGKANLSEYRLSKEFQESYKCLSGIGS